MGYGNTPSWAYRREMSLLQSSHNRETEELLQRIEKLKKENKELKEKNDELKKRVKELEAEKSDR